VLIDDLLHYINGCYGSQLLLWMSLVAMERRELFWKEGQWLLCKVNCCYGKSVVAKGSQLLLWKSVVARRSQWLQLMSLAVKENPWMI
jgi:hypothetical protein